MDHIRRQGKFFNSLLTDGLGCSINWGYPEFKAERVNNLEYHIKTRILHSGQTLMEI